MTDVAIPADTAKQIAHVLRGARIAYPEWCDYWADLLDPPKPQTLVDLTTQVVTQALASGLDPDEFAPDVLTVIWKQIEKVYGQHPNEDARGLRNYLAQLFGKSHYSDWLDE